MPEHVLPAPLPPPTRTPGWARTGGHIGFGLAVIPFALAVASTVAIWTKDSTAHDVLIISAGASTPLLALVPTFAGRSALIDDDAARLPRLFRVIGWVLSIYGAVSMISSVPIAKLWAYGLEKAGWKSDSRYQTAGDVIGSFTTLFNGLICSAGIVFLSIASEMAATRGEGPVIMPTVAFAPSPNGQGFTGIAGFSARF